MTLDSRDIYVRRPYQLCFDSELWGHMTHKIVKALRDDNINMSESACRKQDLRGNILVDLLSLNRGYITGETFAVYRHYAFMYILKPSATTKCTLRLFANRKFK